MGGLNKQALVTQTFLEFAILTHQMKVKSHDLQIALSVATHSFFHAVDPLTNMLKKKFRKVCIVIHQTKCMSLAKSVLEAHFNKELHDDIQDTPFPVD